MRERNERVFVDPATAKRNGKGARPCTGHCSKQHKDVFLGGSEGVEGRRFSLLILLAWNSWRVVCVLFWHWMEGGLFGYWMESVSSPAVQRNVEPHFS